MQLKLRLVPNREPAIQLSARVGGAAVGSSIEGVVSGTDPFLYDFDFGPLADGYYVATLTDPSGVFFIRVVNGVIRYADQWWILENDGLQVTLDPQLLLASQGGLISRNLYLFNAEQRTLTIALTDLHGVTEFAGLTMRFSIETTDRVDVQVVSDLTSNTNTLQVPIAPIADMPNGLIWSLRNQATGKVLGEGTVVLRYAA